jgi:thioredoxin 1
MKPVLMFILESCPYCREALRWMKELKDDNENFAAINVEIIDEAAHPDIAEKYDYYYVPTYYVDGIKVHEGVASKEIVSRVFEEAYE